MPMNDIMMKIDERRDDYFDLVFNWIRQGIIRKPKEFREVMLYMKDRGVIK